MQVQYFKGPFYLFCAFTLAGTSVIAARFVSGQLGVFTITAASLFFAILCLLPLCGHKSMDIVRCLRPGDWLMLFLQALFGIFLFRLFFLHGLLRTSAGEAGILTGATPAVTALLARVVLKEPFTPRSFAGLLSTIGGILLLQGILLPGGEFAMEHFRGNLLVLCAAVSESLFNIFSRLNSLKAASRRKQPLNPVVQTVLVSAMALFLCLIPAQFEEPVLSLLALENKQWLALAWYGVFVTALAFICWYAGIKRSTAQAAAAFSGMMPFTSLILSVIILGEYAGWQQWSGGALVIMGIVLIGARTSPADD